MNAIDELRDFHGFLTEKLKNGGANLSLEEALDEWRELHPEPEEDDGEDDVAAINAALQDRDNGVKGMSMAELDRRVREEFRFPDVTV